MKAVLQDDVRESFRKLAKQYHPDGGSSTADSATFIRIEEAYRKVLSHVIESGKILSKFLLSGP